MLEARSFTTAEASQDTLRRLRELLEGAFEGDFSDEDWEHTLGGWHVAVFDGETPISHAAVVPRRLEVADRTLQAGYVEGVATLSSNRRRGHGAVVMERLDDIVRDEFEIGALSTEEHRFYARLGWERWRGPSYVRRGQELIRTEHEDDGLMVLRFGPSQDIDLAAPIICESRPGDDW